MDKLLSTILCYNVFVKLITEEKTMYICVSCLSELKAGEVVILEKDSAIREMSVRPIGGVISGYVTYTQPEGCVDYKFAYQNIGERRIIGKVAIISGKIALIQSDSDAFSTCVYMPTQRSSYLGVAV